MARMDGLPWQGKRYGPFALRMISADDSTWLCLPGLVIPEAQPDRPIQ